MLRFTARIVLCAFAIGTWAQTPADVRTLRTNLIALERMWNQAQVSRDAGAIAAMIGDRFVNTEFDGKVSKHDKFLADFADPKFHANLMSIDNVEVEVYGNTAIVTGDYHTRGVYNGALYEHSGRFTDTWVFQSGKWLCVASHSSLKK